MLFYFITGVILFLFSIYSYALVDPNITFFQNDIWVGFRDIMVQFGYYQREYSWLVYLLFVVLLFILYFISIRFAKKLDPIKIAVIVALVTLFSYPFLSHDFFNYMFDAKIFTFYHLNPYFHKALDFPGDQWLRFMHWTHRNYPYGPVFLIISFIPSFLGLGKFSLTFFLFKVMNACFYVLSVWFLNRVSKKWAVVFAMHPLILVEGLINGHNDLVGLGLAVIGVYYILQKQKKKGIFFTLLSGGIKFITLPVVFLRKRGKTNVFILLLQFIFMGYLIWRGEIQPWYFLALFAYLPFFSGLIADMHLIFFGLLISYYPYIRLGGWDSVLKVELKHQIILIAFLVNILYVFLRSSRKFLRR